MKIILAATATYIREIFGMSVPLLVSIFGAILFVVASKLEPPTGKLITYVVGGMFLMHALETASSRAEAKAKNAFATALTEMLMDGRDVHITVEHGKSEGKLEGED